MPPRPHALARHRGDTVHDMQLRSLAVVRYVEHDPDRVPSPTSFDTSVALRVLPGECTLTLTAVFDYESVEMHRPYSLPMLFMTHSEEEGASAYSVARLDPYGIEQTEDGAAVVAFYDVLFKPARAGWHALFVEVANGGQIESRDWTVRVRRS